MIDCIYNNGERCTNKLRKRQFGRFGKRLCILFLNPKDICLIRKLKDKDKAHNIEKTLL
jgi:hypothetical protein